MSRDVLMLREPEIRSLLDPAACIEAMERAFAAYSTGQAELPSVIQLDVPENSGSIHVKAGHVRGGPYYAVKIVSGFLNNPQLGLSANDGMVVVFDAKTGAPAAFLLDHGFITDLRTGAAGASPQRTIGIEAKLHMVRREAGAHRREVLLRGVIHDYVAVRCIDRERLRGRMA